MFLVFRIMAQEEKGDSSSFNQDDLPGRCKYVRVKLAFQYRLKGIYILYQRLFRNIKMYEYSDDAFGQRKQTYDSECKKRAFSLL
jgi:hypothetical protein